MTNDEWTKLNFSIKLGDNGELLVEGEDDEDAINQLRGVISMAVDNRLAEEVAAAMELLEERLAERLASDIDDYLHGEVGEAVNELSEAVEGVADMVVTLADCGDEETRNRFYARAAKNAQQQPRPDTDEYRGAKNQDGSHGVEDEQSRQNRQSLSPRSRLGESIVDDNEALRDEILARGEQRKQQFRDSLLEYIEKRDAAAGQGVLGRGVLRG